MLDLCENSASYVRSLAAYQPGKPISELERELGITNIVKLASNENPLGVSPRVLAHLQTVLPEIARYPDGNGFALKQALCEFHRDIQLKEDQIVLGNGSNDVLELVARAFLKPEDEAIYARYAFAVYPLATQAAGAKGRVTAAKNFGHDLDAMLSAINDKTRVIFIANPNNPTGTFLTGSTLLDFVKLVPENVLIVLDEAYCEYLPPDLRIDTPSWINRFPNVLISRTFSKAYGLAGLRVGYGLGHPDVIDLMNRVRQPFNVNQLALEAARIALTDQDFIQQSYALNTAGMSQITFGLEALGLSFIPSFGNFISFQIDNAGEVYQQLLRQGVIVRPIAGYQMPDYLRVSIGLPEENQRFLDALKTVLAQ